MVTTTKLYTAEDLFQMSTDEPWEIWEGELRKVSGSGGDASDLAHWIGVPIALFVRSRRLGMVTGADGAYVLAHDPQTVVLPDIAFVRWERLPGRTRVRGFIPVPPDLAVDVVSPSDRPSDIARKKDLYRTAGVSIVWWVYPDRRIIQVFQDGNPIGEFGEQDTLDGGDVLPDFRLAVAEIFAED